MIPAEQPTPEQAEKQVMETIAQVERLAELAAKFPDVFNPVARQLPAWPVMHFRRESLNHSRVPYRLELGEDYPVDISGDARSHPSSAMGQYLTRCVVRLHRFRLRGEWPADERHGGSSELKSLLESAQRIPPLTKATSDEWGQTVVVPLIMLLDAGADEASCREPALQAVWRQKGVKSRGTFKSRLVTKVRQTLHSLAKSS